jgi:hypothetical protein
MTTCPFNERAEFVGGPWDGRVATAEDGDPLPLEIVVPWRDGRHRYVLHREWYGGLDVEAVDYEYAGPFVVE